MEILIPKGCFNISEFMPEDVVDLVNWVVFIKHLPSCSKEDFEAALPHIAYFDTNNTEMGRLLAVAFQVLEDYYTPGTCFVMRDSLRFYRIRREVCQSHPLDEEFYRHFEYDE